MPDDASSVQPAPTLLRGTIAAAGGSDGWGGAAAAVRRAAPFSPSTASMPAGQQLAHWFGGSLACCSSCCGCSNSGVPEPLPCCPRRAGNGSPAPLPAMDRKGRLRGAAMSSSSSRLASEGRPHVTACCSSSSPTCRCAGPCSIRQHGVIFWLQEQWGQGSFQAPQCISTGHLLARAPLAAQGAPCTAPWWRQRCCWAVAKTNVCLLHES